MTHDQTKLEPRAWVPEPSFAEPLHPDAGYRFGLTSGAGVTDVGHHTTGIADDRKARVLASLTTGDAEADDISGRTGIARQELWPILDELHDNAIIEVVSQQPVAPGPYFRHARSLALRICIAIGVPSVRRRIAEEESDAVLRLGAYIEEYHYIRAAPSYLSGAIALGVTDRQVRILSGYFAEEYCHDLLVRQGLLAEGIPEADLDCTQPLPSTLALVNQLRWLATADLPALCICLGATEGTPDSVPDIDREFDSLRHGNLLPEQVYTPFEKHARIDASQNHGSVFSEAFGQFGPVIPRQRISIRETLWQYWYACLGYHQGILGHYGGRATLPLFRIG